MSIFIGRGQKAFHSAVSLMFGMECTSEAIGKIEHNFYRRDIKNVQNTSK